MRRVSRAVLAILAIAVFGSPGHAEPPGAPTMGGVSDAKPKTWSLRLKHHWTTESLDVVYRIGDAYQPEAIGEINRFLRDWRCNKTAEIDPKLIDRIYELQQQIGPGRTIRVISGFRSEGHNASLLVAGRTVDPESQHMYGRAVDIFVLV